jgi:hypothetical protein|tara:strand:- start:290 stop:532 length:243 start_codon:yes stop_codon:yes gene_type:complete
MSYPEPRLYVPDVSQVANAKNKGRAISETTFAYDNADDSEPHEKERDNDTPRWNKELNATEFASDLYTMFCERNTEDSII